MRRNRTAGVLIAALLLVGCAEDLGPVTDTWNKLRGAMTAQADKLREQAKEARAALQAFPVTAASDAVGANLKAKLGTALAAWDKGVEQLDTSVVSATSAVQDALKTGKVASVQKAMDTSRMAYDTVAGRVGEARTAATAALAQLKAHQAQLQAEAARIHTAGTTLDFTDIDFKAGKADFLFDRPNTQATLDKLLAFVNSCPEMVVDITGHTSNEGSAAANKKLSVARAAAVKKWLGSQGVAAKKVHSVSGVGNSVNVVPEPEPGSAAAKAMPATQLEELRRKNRRITLEVVTPCP